MLMTLKTEIVTNKMHKMQRTVEIAQRCERLDSAKRHRKLLVLQSKRRKTKELTRIMMSRLKENLKCERRDSVKRLEK